jgi:hypothetical protein
MQEYCRTKDIKNIVRVWLSIIEETRCMKLETSRIKDIQGDIGSQHNKGGLKELVGR